MCVLCECVTLDLCVAFDYPFYAIQFHPEKNGFEWTTKEDIPHSESAVSVMQALANFFVQEGEYRN